MKKVIRNNIPIFIIFFSVLFAATYGLLSGYFQQDEWLGLALAMKSYNLPWWDVFVPGNMHFAPLGKIFWRVMYRIFALRAEYYFLIELIIHALTSTLVYVLSTKLTKNKVISALTAFLFLLNGRAHQAFTHLAIFHVTTTTMFLIMLFFVYLSTINEKVLNIKQVVILFLIFLASILTREEGFIIIPITIAYLYSFDRKKFNKKNFKVFVVFSLGIVSFLIVRVFAQKLYTEPIPVIYQLTGNGAEYNLLTIPIKFVVQNLIYSERIALFYLNHFVKIYPDIESYFASQAPLMDAAFFYIFGILASIKGVWLWLVRPKKIKAIIAISITWILSNAFILAFIGRHLSVLEPRYLYYSSFPVFLVTSIILYDFYIFKPKKKLIGLLNKFIVSCVIVLLFVASFQEIRVAVNRQKIDGVAKKQIFESLKEIHPVLSDNTIFYITCRDKCYRNSEFGIPVENVLPFSSGPGMIFLTVFAQGQEEKWGNFFTQKFLFDIYAEDYKKMGDKSFGYFVTKSKLEETLNKNKLSLDTVVALEVDEKDYTFTDISEDFRKSLKLN
ncbi:hypothetical protein ACFL1A_00190 [Patescibacteria group bacterium]